MAFVAIPALSFATDPRECLRNLGSESFQTRSAAEERLGEWAEENASVAKAWLATSMEATEDPEVKQRLRKVLKNLVVGEALASGPGYVGIQMAPTQLVLPREDRVTGGVSVQAVVPGTPAEHGGIKPGDIIVSLDGRKWSAEEAVDQFREGVASKRPGAKVKLGVLREGEVRVVEVVLAPKPLVLPELAFGVAGEGGDVSEAEEQAKEELFRTWLNDWRVSRAPVAR